MVEIDIILTAEYLIFSENNNTEETKMKKFLSILAAVIMVLSLSVSAFAFDGEANIALFVMTTDGSGTLSGEPVTVNADGTYTVKLTDVSIDEFSVATIYIKDAAVEAQEVTSSNLPADLQIVTKELKINGNPVELTEGYATTLNDSGVFDVCWYNIWATHYCSIDGIGEITEIEATFEVISSDSAAEETAPEATVDPVTDTETETDTTEAPAKTGIALAVLPMVIAVAAVAVSKKR